MKSINFNFLLLFSTLLLCSGFHFHSTEYDFFRKYHSFSLPNKLQVLIVSDQTQKNGLILSVDVGSSYEPRNLSGLAHLLEHMLFFSTKKYPSEYYFKHFLATAQGSMNAHTWDSETMFFFEMNAQKLENFDKAVDIFSRFFIDPIFTEEAIRREINAVHNEYENFLSSEQWRLQEVIRNIADKSSVLNHFQIGDNKHLADKNISILTEIQNFFDSYYSAHKMQLVVYSNFPIETMETLVKEKFGFVKNKENKWKYPKHFVISPKNENQAFTENSLGRYVWYKSLDPKKMVILVFPLEKELLDINIQVKPLEFIRRMLAKKGKNSFYSIMKKEGLISDVTMSIFEHYVDFKMIVVKMVVAAHAEEKITSLLQFFFGFMRKILKHGVTENIYKRLSFENFYEYLYEEKKPITEELKELLTVFKEKKSVDKLKVEEFRNMVKFDKNHIAKYLKLMSTPEKALIIFSSSLLQVSTDYTKIFRFQKLSHQKKTKKMVNKLRVAFLDKYGKSNLVNLSNRKTQTLFSNKKLDHFDTTMKFFYTFEKISANQLKYLKVGHFPLNSSKLFKSNYFSPQELNIETECNYQVQRMPLMGNSGSYKIEYNPKFLHNVLYETFNEPESTNKMIDVACLQKEKLKEIHQDYPILLSNLPKLEVWWKSFRVFQVPKISSIFKLKGFNQGISFAKEHIFLKIFLKLFQEKYWENLNQMKDAHYEIDFEVKEDWIQMSVFGFSDKFELVIKSVFDLLVKSQFPEEAFQIGKQTLLWEMIWKIKDHSFEKMFKYIDEFLNPKLFLDNDLIIKMKTYTYENFSEDIEFFKKFLSVKVLFVGNILKKKAKNLGEILQQYVDNTKQRPENLKKKAKFCLLDKGITSLTVKEISSNQGDNSDATIVVYYKENYSAKDLIILDLMIRQFESEAFKFLRTKHQLGYIVGARVIKNSGIIGVLIYMRGSRFDASQMEEFSQKFIVYFREYIEKNPSFFKTHLGSAHQEKNTHSDGIVFLNPNLKANAMKYFDGINAGRFLKFKQKSQSKEIGKREVLKFYDDLFFLNKRKITFQLYAVRNAPKFERERKNYEEAKQTMEKTVFSFTNFHSFISHKN